MSQQTSQLPLALRSLPPEVGLCRSSIPGAGYGICAKRTIPYGAWIGPYEGKFVKPEELSPSTDTSYMWEVCIFVSYKDMRNVVLTFESVDEILQRKHSNESY